MVFTGYVHACEKRRSRGRGCQRQSPLAIIAVRTFEESLILWQRHIPLRQWIAFSSVESSSGGDLNAAHHSLLTVCHIWSSGTKDYIVIVIQLCIPETEVFTPGLIKAAVKAAILCNYHCDFCKIDHRALGVCIALASVVFCNCNLVCLLVVGLQQCDLLSLVQPNRWFLWLTHCTVSRFLRVISNEGRWGL